MKYIDKIRSVGCHRLNDLLIISIPFYLRAHKWNIGDDISSLYEYYKKHIINNVVRFIDIEQTIDGNVVFTPIRNIDDSNPCTYDLCIGTCDFFEAVYSDIKRHNLEIPIELYDYFCDKVTAESVVDTEYAIDKAIFNNIVHGLYLENPDISVRNILAHNKVKYFKFHSKYKNKDTIMDWLKEFRLHHLPEILDFIDLLPRELETEPQNSTNQKPVHVKLETESNNRLSKDIPAALDKESLTKEIRSQAGAKKGEKWRNFVSDIINPVIERELRADCKCLHRDLAALLNDELTQIAKYHFEQKYYAEQIQPHLPQKIEEAIKDIFYIFGEKYDNVQSRVFRGKHYNDYIAAPCDRHPAKQR